MSSPAMEQEGLVRGLKVLSDAGVKVSSLVTCGHYQNDEREIKKHETLV